MQGNHIERGEENARLGAKIVSDKRVITYDDGSKTTTTTFYDEDGWVTRDHSETVDKDGKKLHTQNRKFDKHGRIGWVQDFDETARADASEKKPRETETTITRDKSGRITKKVKVICFGRHGHTETQEYDPETGEPKGEPKKSDAWTSQVPKC